VLQIDVSQVTNFRRKVLEFRVETLPACDWGGRQLLQLHMRGTAFLWHQVGRVILLDGVD
jgi:tRNA pseudouridine38/39 synthase